jgi:hypothetical protein
MGLGGMVKRFALVGVHCRIRGIDGMPGGWL